MSLVFQMQEEKQGLKTQKMKWLKTNIMVKMMYITFDAIVNESQTKLEQEQLGLTEHIVERLLYPLTIGLRPKLSRSPLSDKIFSQ